MERVTGIGGVFFPARDPDALTQWYSAALGIDPPPESYGVSSWRQEAGPTVFAAMAPGSGHFEDGTRSWAVNFRVVDLDAMVEQLRALDVVGEVHDEEYPNGRFAELHDPEGNAIQLWEPAGADGV